MCSMGSMSCNLKSDREGHKDQLQAKKVREWISCKPFWTTELCQSPPSQSNKEENAGEMIWAKNREQAV